jgi:hypothetical protein
MRIFMLPFVILYAVMAGQGTSWTHDEVKILLDTNEAPPQTHEHALTAKRCTVSSRGRKPTVVDP